MFCEARDLQQRLRRAADVRDLLHEFDWTDLVHRVNS
jgi:hypothetical protein